MIYLYTQKNEYFNDICEEIRIFFGDVKIEMLNENIIPQKGDGIIIDDDKVYYYKDSMLLGEYTLINTEVILKNPLVIKKYEKRRLKQGVFRLLKAYFADVNTPWGSLTGIRPTKLMRELISEFDENTAKNMFINEFDVSLDKTNLALEINRRQAEILDSIKQNQADIYIGIPFCPSRCAYCSFASNDIAKTQKYVDEYLEKLIFEIAKTCEEIKFNARCIYIGGGTPTTLNEAQLDKLLSFLDKTFANVFEYTIEAGRPDTITKQKLEIMKGFKVNRISINPQTMKEQTLKIIGRSHTVKDICKAFETAYTAGFENINADLIAGLANETAQDVACSLKKLINLNPSSITVHTLAVKRASRLSLNKEEQIITPAEEITKMVDNSYKMLTGSNFLPYYMYRQKYMSGNLENVGYCKEGLEGIYNIDIMEEAVSIIAFGAGGISKRIFDKNRLERSPNVSDLKNYLERTDEMIKRKINLFT